jgi:peptidyl-prolyl cis-trans isomerase A (cyclophilin A)/peptidyl-prolyl cis-trans isomerase B (cyclophilin B)
MKRKLLPLLAFVGATLLASITVAVPMAEAKNPVVVIKTSMGTIKAEIYADKAPGTAENFLKYVDDKFYDGLIFHRVIPGFMIQGGGMDKNLEQRKTRAPIKNEASNGVKNTVGTLSMARTMDPNSATAQFFINTVDNKSLDYNERSAGYAVFGKVTEGMDVVNKISAVKTGTPKPMMSDVPETAVTIESIRRDK